MSGFVAIRSMGRAAIDGRLTAADCRLLVSIGLVEAVALMAVRCTPIPVVRRWLAKIQPLALALRGPCPEARVLWALDASARSIGRSSTCLARALAAEILLPAGHRPLTLVIGVTSPAAGVLQSHAWIERGGLVLVGESSARPHHVPLVAWHGAAR